MENMSTDNLLSLGVVIVTYNRLNKLKKTLQLFHEQEVKLEYILVFDNASTDGTEDYLKIWKSEERNNICRIVIRSSDNTGGSGGFAGALIEAQKQDAEWIWLSDDDAFPEKDALLKAKEYLTLHQEKEKISAICGEVINEGEIDTQHRRRIRQTLLHIKEIDIDPSEYNKESFELDEFSYVGVILKKSVLKEAGITKADYFINYDDTEHSMRIRKMGRIICVPAIKIHHDSGKMYYKTVTWTRYYYLRNRYFALRDNFPHRYCLVYYCETSLWLAIKKIFKLKRKEELDMYQAAMLDIKLNKHGKHDIYKPGWRFSE